MVVPAMVRVNETSCADAVWMDGSKAQDENVLSIAMIPPSRLLLESAEFIQTPPIAIMNPVAMSIRPDTQPTQ